MNTYICLENIRSLYNIGAIFRTCSFFNIKDIILLGYSGKKNNQLHPEILKTSLGSEKDLNIILLENTKDLINFKNENNLKIIAIEQHEDSTYLKDTNKDIFNNSIIVFGNEVTGVSEEILDISEHIIEIERLGKHNSLNVTTACGIVCYQLKNPRD